MSLDGITDFVGTGTDDCVCSASNRDGPFRVFPNGDAGNAKAGGFFLNPAGIRDHERCVLHQAEKIKIADRREHMNSVAQSRFLQSVRRRLSILELEVGFEPELADALLRSGMRRKENRTGSREILQTFEDT